MGEIISIIVLIFFFGLPILSVIIDDTNKKRYEKLERANNAKYNAMARSLNENFDKKEKELQQRQKSMTEALLGLLDEHKQNQPWISNIFAEFTEALDQQKIHYLEYKDPPAPKAADTIRAASKEKKELQRIYRMTKYQLEYYELLFPWLEEFKEIDINEAYQIVKNDTDTQTDEYEHLRQWLSPEEYQKLTTAEKYQLALDRYRNRKNKTKWHIGIEYERYIGYIYEQKGFKVTYTGALDGLNDLGRDLIAEKNNKTLVIQCKYWNDNKTIHEKHIFQLFGTVMSYRLHHPNTTVTGVFITSTQLSKNAKIFADELKLKVQENLPMDKNYPCIKCNINRTTKEKIYHLPFDQQYDKITITTSTGECYTKTTAEAEMLGFRHAFHWNGKTEHK